MNLSRSRPRVVLSLTPLIDVVFILLVFFMLVSQFADWRARDLIPRAALSTAAADTTPLSFEILNDGGFRIGGETRDSLQAAIAATRRAAPETVIVRAQGQAAFQRVVDAVEGLKAAGITSVELARDMP